MPDTSVACLVGNGLSISYNPDLSVPSLSQGIKDAFTNLGGSAASDALRSFALGVAGDDPGTNFESLLAPLEHVGSVVSHLGGLAGVTAHAPGAVTGALNATKDFLLATHRLGLATVLDLIADRSHHEPNAFAQTVSPFCDALIALPHLSTLTVATLNYDGLLHAGLVDHPHTADLAHGQQAAGVALVNGGNPSQLWPLRTGPGFPDGTTRVILQLHGSLGWLRLLNGAYRKATIDSLRAMNYWGHLGQGAAQADPVVVLTDRKESAVADDPFSLAYSIFGRSLVRSQRWLIVGYGFGDEPVNAALKGALDLRRGLGMADPQVLVVGHGDAGQLAQRVRTALSDPLPTLTSDGGGVPGAIGAAAWNAWSQSAP